MYKTKKPIMPPKMGWYKFLRVMAVTGGVRLILRAIIEWMIIVLFIKGNEANMGSDLADILGIGTNPIIVALLMIIDISCAIVLLWLFVNMPYLTKKVYAVFTGYWLAWAAFCGLLTIVSLIMYAIDKDYELLSYSAYFAMFIIYSVLNLIYIKKRKKYFIYGTNVPIGSDAQADTIRFTCTCKSCGKNINARYRVTKNVGSIPTVFVNCPQCQTRNNVRLRIPESNTMELKVK